MSKVITFSRRFPSYHPRFPEETFFVEKILNQLNIDYRNKSYKDLLFYLNEWSLKDGKLSDFDLLAFIIELNKNMSLRGYARKSHTIRGSNRFKIGEKFSPRVWSYIPYKSPQIIFAPDIEIKKVWNFEIKDRTFFVNDKDIDEDIVSLCYHDGLYLTDFIDWFQYPKPFSGQIICWNENIKY